MVEALSSKFISAEKMDRLSNLPDVLLYHALSFLTTKNAALTSVLSKRWRNLFAFAPNLDIDDSVFLHPEDGKRERDGILQSFMEFVDRVLALQGDSPINKVSIKCQTGVDTDRVNHWISNVLRRGVSDLTLSIVFEDRYWLSPEGFKNSKLVKLEIGSEIDLGWSTGSIFLPILKTFVLTSVEFCVDMLDKLLPACPALEKLVLINTNWIDYDATVSSASLKNLYIYGGACSSTFSFDTPSLVRFSWCEFGAEDYPVVNMENLVDARIFLSVTAWEIGRVRGAPNNDWLEDDEDEEDDVVLRLSNVLKLMNGIRNVQQLYLSPDTLEVLSLFCESMPVFNNLKLLIIECDEGRGWQAMPVLLKNCPNLETLAMGGLLHHVTDKCGDACDCISHEEKGRSLKSCPVKKLMIYGFKGTMRETSMIRNFLESFKCLKEVKIRAEENAATNFEVHGVYEHVVEIINLYNELWSCDVRFLVPGYMYREWSEKWSLRG